MRTADVLISLGIVFALAIILGFVLMAWLVTSGRGLR